MSEKAKRRYEPDRRERLIEVALDVIAQHGVAGTTHRRVAEAADVPLGSMTYHFKDMEELLVASFTRLTEQIAKRFQEALEAATTLDEARSAVVELICGGLWASERNMVLSHELYAYSSRNARLKEVWLQWMNYSGAHLEKHFSPRTARILDALIEGVTIHNTADKNRITRGDVRAVVLRLTT